MNLKDSRNVSRWKIRIDTGGTFTDCIARDPKGVEHRCKVLSSSALRGRSIEKTGTSSIRCELNADLPDHFFNGYTFRWLRYLNETWSISGYDATEQVLHFSNPIRLPDAQNPAFEILSPEEAPILASRIVTDSPFPHPLPPIEMRLATTRGTNALLERNGGKTLLLVTRGFKDLLRIRNQQRPDLFALKVDKPLPFYDQVIEIPERMDAEGNVLLPLNTEDLEDKLGPHLPGIDSVAICLMNSPQNPVHEQHLKTYLESKGVQHLSVSSELSPLIKIIPRAMTTEVNAYLAPVMERYLRQVGDSLSDDRLYIMNSTGNLTHKNRYAPKDGLLSGPAGGVAGAVSIGNRSGFQKMISFDMGGTSTDVARYNGQYDYQFQHSVGDATLQAPALSIVTVAAGGGSICNFDGESLTVGPGSAGADPGPACYGAGGPLTLTDVNLLTGRLVRTNFHFPVHTEAADEAFEEIFSRIQRKRGTAVSRQKILEGFLDIANERMAQSILTISLEKGFDPGRYCLVSFGGAGGQHATAVAGKLGMKTVLSPSDAGLLSAHGLDQSTLEKIETEQLLQPLDKTEQRLPELFERLEQNAVRKLSEEGIDKKNLTLTRASIFARLEGQESTLELPFRNIRSLRKDFVQLYRDTYGHWIENREIEIESIRVIVTENKDPRKKATLPPPADLPEPVAFQDLLFNGQNFSMPVIHRSKLTPGCRVVGPSLILDPYSTVLVEPGWSGKVYSDYTVVLSANDKEEQDSTVENAGSGSAGHSSGKNPEIINLQLYTNRFSSIAEQMGEMLRRTALSVNVKERLDFSCALLDAQGYLVVNAPHIPVHLGAMGLCVRTLMETIEMEEGDVVITNHPGFGGSHLPDVTVITPVFYRGKRIGFVANRAHHAEIGGKSPGSMPPDAKNLAEEGVVIPPMHLIRKGREHWSEIRNLLQAGSWPSRSVEENLTDLQAAVAANHRGAGELKKLAGQFGGDEVTRYMTNLKEYASERMKQALKKIDNGVYEAEEYLDDQSKLKVLCRIEEKEMEIDFSGTDRVHPGNLNANPAIVNSVIIYLLRLLVDEPLPLNDGLLSPVSIHLPEGMLNPTFPDDPADCPAVVGGNIETSQRLVDTFLKAFGLAACSQGTMNNVLFGNDSFGYYETVGGGTGAGNGFHGADAVHHHMTNTRATDPEILEHHYPVRLDRYAIRTGSGGDGAWHGGNGIIREMTFLEPVCLSVLSQHRVVPPYGLHGGSAGKTGLNRVEKKDGTTLELEWKDGMELEPGDKFILYTP
ncbi:MAG: hydantoinase B/oxoprolinase family protein, partial [Balneolaceae bacterium]